MKKMTQGTLEGTKSLYEAAVEDLESKHHVRVIAGEIYWKGIDQEAMEGRLYKFTEEQLDSLQWAKEFMDGYERKHKITMVGRLEGDVPGSKSA